jgi:hypothetical protein
MILSDDRIFRRLLSMDYRFVLDLTPDGARSKVEPMLLCGEHRIRLAPYLNEARQRYAKPLPFQIGGLDFAIEAKCASAGIIDYYLAFSVPVSCFGLGGNRKVRLIQLRELDSKLSVESVSEEL